VERTHGVVVSDSNAPSLFAKLVALVHHKKPTAVDPKLAANKKAAVTDGQPQPVHFDFYDELPNMQMPAEDSQPSSVASAPAPTPKPALPESVAEAPSASAEPEVANATPPTNPGQPAAPIATVAEAKPAQPVPVSAAQSVAVNATQPSATPAPRLATAKPVASTAAPRIFNPEEVSDLLAAEHGVSRYVIQLGVFQSEEAANRLREAIVSVGFDAVVVKVKEGNHKSYHVQQGPYATAELAKVSQQRLEKRGIISIIKKASV
jgi:cell division protein FtsN